MTCGGSTPAPGMGAARPRGPVHQAAAVFHGLAKADGPAQLAGLARAHLSPAGQQIALWLRMLEVTGGELDALRAQLVSAAGQLRGARVLAGQLYGAGPVTALALCCWLGGAGLRQSGPLLVATPFARRPGPARPGRLARRP